MYTILYPGLAHKVRETPHGATHMAENGIVRMTACADTSHIRRETSRGVVRARVWGTRGWTHSRRGWRSGRSTGGTACQSIP
jgi:hypothetical protein